MEEENKDNGIAGLTMLSFFVFVSTVLLSLFVDTEPEGGITHMFLCAIILILSIGWAALFVFIIGYSIHDFLNNDKD